VAVPEHAAATVFDALTAELLLELLAEAGFEEPQHISAAVHQCGVSPASCVGETGEAGAHSPAY
jgi:hypothetical protein